MTDRTPNPGGSARQRGPQTAPPAWMPLAKQGNRPPPELYAHLQSHVEAERGLLEEYSAAAEQSQSKALRYLINLLIEDEIRHHRIFTDLVESVKAREVQYADGHWNDEDPIIPHIDFDRTDQAAVIDITEQLLQKEQQDAHELKRLQRELRDTKETTLWSLLVELMERDTQKHIAILRFARKHAGRRRR
jgi:rubrerythrin